MKPVLIVQHAPHEHPAILLRLFENQGTSILWIHPYRGDSFPRVSEISGLISLGGPMSANDDAQHSWIQPELELLRECVSAKIPVVGVCLGGQLLARALGGRVEKNHTPEIGWMPVNLSKDGMQDPLMNAAGPSPLVYHWHEDTFYPPANAVTLASSPTCERQAYRIGKNVYGFQFHMETDLSLVEEWLAVEGVPTYLAGLQSRHGKMTVQDGSQQLALAAQGEPFSLKISKAVAALFKA